MKSSTKILMLISFSVLLTMVSPALTGQAMTSTNSKSSDSQQKKIVEIRTYNLKENTRDSFHQLFVEKAMPMLKKWGIEVVGYGPSVHDKNTYTLIREYKSLEHMQKSEDAFYGSEEWKKGPREAILALIDNYTTLVINGDDDLIAQLRKSLSH